MGCIFQDVEPPKSKSILRTSPKSLGPKRSVQFSEMYTAPREKSVKKGTIVGCFFQKCEPHERSLHAPNFEDGSEEESLRRTMRPQRCVGNGEYVHKIQEKGESHFLFAFKSLVITSAIFDDTRGRSLCGLNLNELEIVRVSRKPTTVATADGEVQTSEEASAHVHDLDLFVTVQILGDTPAVLSPCELCEDHGYSLEWASGQKPHLTLKRADQSNAPRNTMRKSLSQD